MDLRVLIALTVVAVQIPGTVYSLQRDVSGATRLQPDRFVTPPHFSITGLPAPENFKSYARAINDKGQVVGLLAPVAKEGRLSLPDQVVFWNGQKVTRLPILPVIATAAVNNNGSVLISREDEYPLRRKGDASGHLWHPLKNSKTAVKLKTKKSFPPQFHRFTALNDAGLIVGYSGSGLQDKYARSSFQAFSLRNGRYQYLSLDGMGANSYAFGINNRGQIVGKADTSPERLATHAVSWKDNRIEDLGAHVGRNSCAFDVNDRGEVVGFVEILSEEKHPDYRRHAFVYKEGKMQDLGTPDSIAYSINNEGQIVGAAAVPSAAGSRERTSHAVLWQGGRFYDLNDCLENGSGWQIEAASSINNRGQIVGSGIYKGEHRAFMLTPVQRRGSSAVQVTLSPRRAR